MSMPSLVISENNASENTAKDKKPLSGNSKQSAKKSSLGTGAPSSKKVVTESISAPLIDCEANDVKQQNVHVSKRSERRNKKYEKGADEITKDIRCKENSVRVAVIDSSDQKGDVKNKEKTHEEPVPESVLVQEKNKNNKDLKSETPENIQDEECSLEQFLESNNLVCNHTCDPAIPEISETSDAEDDENKEKDASRPEAKVCSVPGAMEEEAADLDQQADPEVRYDCTGLTFCDLLKIYFKLHMVIG